MILLYQYLNKKIVKVAKNETHFLTVYSFYLHKITTKYCNRLIKKYVIFWNHFNYLVFLKLL